MRAAPFLALRYLALAVGLAAWAGAYAARQHWVGDFWEHAAVLAELQRHLLSPGHPLLAIDAPSYFYSPYHLTLGVVAWATGLHPTWVLSVAGVVNVGWLAVAVWMLCRSLYGQAGLRAAFFALLLLVFFWGDREWFWSGFVHAGVLGYVASYPSTFALATSLACIAWAPRLARTDRWLGWGAFSVVLAALLVIHTVTALFAAVGVTAMLARTAPEARWRRPLASAGVAVGLAALWPMYPFLRLFVTGTETFHERSLDLYQLVWMRAYPILLGIPVVLWRLRQDRRDPLAWTLIGLGALYGLGAAVGRYGLGRLMSPLAVVVQVGLAGTLGRLEMSARRGWPPRAGLALASLGLLWLVAKQDGSLRRATDDPPLRPHRAYGFLATHVAPDDVVLANLEVGNLVPSFAGKVVASYRHVYWVDDYPSRQADVNTFFDPGTTGLERSAMAARYDADYVLAAPGTAWPGLGPEVARSQDLVLYRTIRP